MKLIEKAPDPHQDMLKAVGRAEKAARKNKALTEAPFDDSPLVHKRTLGDEMGYDAARIYDEEITGDQLREDRMFNLITGLGVKPKTDRYIEAQRTKKLPSGMFSIAESHIETAGKHKPKVVKAQTVFRRTDGEKVLHSRVSYDPEIAVKAIAAVARQAETQHKAKRGRGAKPDKRRVTERNILEKGFSY